MFMLLTKLILADINNISLIAIEEPENSVHPSLFHAYIQIIEQLLNDCKIIITSHSPYIITYLDPSCIRVGINRQAGLAEFFKFKKTGIKALHQDAVDLNMTMGDCLFSMLSDDENDWEQYLECDTNE